MNQPVPDAKYAHAYTIKSIIKVIVDTTTHVFIYCKYQFVATKNKD